MRKFKVLNQIGFTLLVVFFLNGQLKAETEATPNSNAQSNVLTEKNLKYEPKFAINVEPLWAVIHGLAVKFEYFTTPTVSIGISDFYYNYRNNNINDDDSYNYDNNYRVSHNELLLGANVMLTGTLGTHGLYINPSVGYQTTKISEYSSFNLSGENSSALVRMTIGYQWILVKHLRLAAGGGVSALADSKVVVKDNNGEEVLNKNTGGLGGLALDLHVGYVF